MRLLVIEDDPVLLESLCRQLKEAGFGVEQAADGREGLYFALEYPIDLAIVDLGLPEVSGLDVILAAELGLKADHVFIAGQSAHQAQRVGLDISH